MLLLVYGLALLVVIEFTYRHLFAAPTAWLLNNGQASKQAADARAKKLAWTIRALQAKGHISFSAITKHVSRNSHRAETEGGLRRIGQPPDVDEGGPRPRAPEALTPVLQLSACVAVVLSRITC